MWKQTLFLFFCLVSVSRGEDDLGELVMVQILYRHGQRTPSSSYPTDPYRNVSFWPVNWGQLTDQGKLDQYHLGKWIRTRYADFQPSAYSELDIYVQSTDMDRTLMSAYSNLAGLYEPVGSNWNAHIDWQPIPVHTEPITMDTLLLPVKPCLRHSLMQEALIENCSPNFTRNHAALMKYVGLNSGMTIDSFSKLASISETLLAEDLYGLKLPLWTKLVYPYPLIKHLEKLYDITCFTDEMCRLRAGPLIKDLIKHFRSKIGDNLSQKMWVYSAHDATLADLMKGLHVYDQRIPPYCSTILLELRKKNDDYYVAIFYKKPEEPEPRLLKVPGCKELCPFEEFVNITAPMVSDNWEKECNDLSFDINDNECPYE